jgi:YcxB-like protein
MLESKDRIVHVDATIELKDYFYAYFDAAKRKLIISCLIVATVIAAFSYFFILIGEQKILWQLSPLFFGLPIVAIAGQFLRMHASYRKYLADLSESEKNIHYMFHENGDGFDIVRGKNFGHVAWESVRRVIERPRYFHFVLNKYESIIIPKRFLSQGSNEKLMRKIIVSQLGSKAKLLG